VEVGDSYVKITNTLNVGMEWIEMNGDGESQVVNA
jgi:hypothetical protein